MKTTLKVIFCLFFCFSQAQSIERQVIGVSGETLSNGTVSLDFTVGELAVTSITNGTTTLNQGFHQPNIVLGIKVNTIAFLQGALLNSTNGLMRDDLRAGFLPTTSPYSDTLTCVPSVFNTGGTSGTGLDTDDIVDWIFVELRDENDNINVIANQSALLQRDGDIVSVDGISDLEFNVAAKNYYVVVKHRNHLGIMTANTVALSSTLLTVDFTDANNQVTFGTNAQTTFGMPSGVVALWAGDTNGDGRLNYSGTFSDIPSIRSHVFNDPNNSVFGGPPAATYQSIGYFGTDVNMEGLTVYSGANSDVPNIRNNIFNNSSNSVFGGPPAATYVFIQQLPGGAN
ncbi:hemagglutinin protein [Lacinutrix sp. Bg11-31]|uniref:hemagglutinin protein n=1 Tax=Lacinutrix sp. Bg11-31 TaxID=2057808 RepID=UPI000C30D066|nr:hemagglutinin protein [Lacinutrix sp. Bg11-31]AUC83236.1 hemagglutinin protein [Lacinutrix sp. Bg11-31]